MRAAHATCCLVLLCALGPAHTSAQSAAAVRLLVRIDGEAIGPLVPRIRGQLSDYDVEVVAARTASVEPTLPEQLATADELAASHDADAIVWLELGATQGQLVLLAIEGRRVFTRPVDGVALDEGESAEREQVALIVRTALAAMVAGQQIGDTEERAIEEAATEPEVVVPIEVPGTEAPGARTEESAQLDGADEPELVEQEPVEQEPVEQEPVEQEPAEPLPVETTTRAVATLGVGWRLSWDGVAPRGAHELALDSELRRRHLVLGLRVGVGLPSQIDHELASFTLSTHSLVARVGVAVELSRTLAAHAFGEVGGRATVRRTDETGATVMASEASWAFMFTAALELRLEWRPAPRFAVGVVAGAAFATPAPTFVVQGTTPEPTWETLLVQPVLGLELRYLFGA